MACSEFFARRFAVGRVWDSCGCLSCLGVLEVLFNTSNAVSFFLFLMINTETLVPLNSKNQIVRSKVLAMFCNSFYSYGWKDHLLHWYVFFSSLTALSVSLKMRYIISCSVEVRQSRLIFSSSIKLLWRVFGTASERNNTCVEPSRALWNSQSGPVSIRILPDLVSSSPFPSPLPRFFCPRTVKTRSGDEISQC